MVGKENMIGTRDYQPEAIHFKAATRHRRMLQQTLVVSGKVFQIGYSKALRSCEAQWLRQHCSNGSTFIPRRTGSSRNSMQKSHKSVAIGLIGFLALGGSVGAQNIDKVKKMTAEQAAILVQRRVALLHCQSHSTSKFSGLSFSVISVGSP